MKISETQLKKFQSLWKSKTGKELTRKEALLALRNLVSFVKLEVEQVIKEAEESGK